MGMDVRSDMEYVNKQIAFRSGQGRVLKLTPEQETKLEESMKVYNNKYNALTSNCMSPVQEGLNKVGVDAGGNLFPDQFGASLDKSGYVDSYINYPQRTDYSNWSMLNNASLYINTAMIAIQAIQAIQATTAVAEGTVTIGTVLEGANAIFVP
jgi:hypothetical protein